MFTIILHSVPDNKSTQRTSFSYPSPLLKGKGPNSLESDGKIYTVTFPRNYNV